MKTSLYFVCVLLQLQITSPGDCALLTRPPSISLNLQRGLIMTLESDRQIWQIRSEFVCLRSNGPSTRVYVSLSSSEVGYERSARRVCGTTSPLALAHEAHPSERQPGGALSLTFAISAWGPRNGESHRGIQTIRAAPGRSRMPTVGPVVRLATLLAVDSVTTHSITEDLE